MASTKKASSAANNSRPKSTSALSAPAASLAALVPPAPPALFAFNPQRTLFAGVSVNHVGSSGRERLRVWDVQAGAGAGGASASANAVVAEWELGAEMLSEDGSNPAVRAVLWLDGNSDVHADASASKKKRRHSGAKGGEAAGAGADVLVAAQRRVVGFKTDQTKPAFRWAVPAQQGGQVTAAVHLPAQNAVAIALEKSGVVLLSLADGSVILTARYPTNATAPSCIALLGGEKSDALTLLLGNLAITPLTISLPLSSTSTSTFSAAQNIAIALLRFALPIGPSQLLHRRRGRATASLWSVGEEVQLALAATIPLPTDAPVHHAAASMDGSLLALLAMSGEVALFSTDLSTGAASSAAETDAVSPGKKKKKAKAKGIPSLKPVSVVRVTEGKEGRQAGLAAVALPAGDEAVLLFGRMGGGGRIVWDTARFTDSLGDHIPAVNVKKSAMTAAPANNADDSIPVNRYQQDGAVAGRATLSAFADQAAADASRAQLELPVDGDLADLTLGERLAVLEGGLPSGSQALQEDEDDDDEPMNGASTSDKRKKAKPAQEAPKELPIQTTQSLTRLLSQALHSNDQPLLTLILTSPSNSSASLVRNTIRKMPASLALPLLKACVDRLGKGSQFERRGGGRGGGIAPTQGRGVVAWIKGVLVERGSILMTIPSLPVHLSGLSQILSSRLAMNQPLLALSGRLDLALAQIEMRKALVAASAQPASAGRRYVEGESSSDEDMDSDAEDDVEIERDDGSGEVEDVRMTSSRQSRQLEESDLASVPDPEQEEDDLGRKAKKGKGKVISNGEAKAKGAMLEDEDESDSDDDDDEESDEDDEEDEDLLDDDEDDSDDNRNPLIDDEASESDGDEDEDEDMEE